MNRSSFQCQLLEGHESFPTTRVKVYSLVFNYPWGKVQEVCANELGRFLALNTSCMDFLCVRIGSFNCPFWCDWFHLHKRRNDALNRTYMWQNADLLSKPMKQLNDKYRQWSFSIKLCCLFCQTTPPFCCLPLLVEETLFVEGCFSLNVMYE